MAQKIVIELENEHECAALLFSLMTTLQFGVSDRTTMAAVIDSLGPRIIDQVKAQGFTNDGLLALARRMMNEGGSH